MAIVIVILLVGLFIYYFSKKTSVKPEQKHLTIDDKYNEEIIISIFSTIFNLLYK